MFEKIITWLTGLHDPDQRFRWVPELGIRSATVFATVTSIQPLSDREIQTLVKKNRFGISLPVESVDVIDEDRVETYQYTVRIEFDKAIKSSMLIKK